MYLTQQTDYALRVLIYAAVNSDHRITIMSISEAYGISKNHLMKVVTALIKGGFLIGVRGKGGGLKLARAPQEISIGAVVSHMENMDIVECARNTKPCAIAS